MILKLILRNAFRHRLRTALTVAGVAIAILAFGLLRTLVGLWYLGVESSSADPSGHAQRHFPDLPPAHLLRRPHPPGAGGGDGRLGHLVRRHLYQDEKNFFANFAVEPRSYLELYPEFVLPPEQEAAFLRDRKGRVVGPNLAEKFGWKVGDRVTLSGTIFPGQWDFVLRGIYRGAKPDHRRTQFFFHWDYLNETMKKTTPRRADQVGFFMLGVDRPERAPEVAVAVDSLFNNSLAETHTETEKAFQLGFVAMTEAILIAIRIVSYVVIVIIMVVAANTMAMTARERIGEYATLKTLGFGPRYIAGTDLRRIAADRHARRAGRHRPDLPRRQGDWRNRSS